MDNATYRRQKSALACTECGEEMWIADDGTSYHLGDGYDDIDHDLDADHVALAPDAEED